MLRINFEATASTILKWWRAAPFVLIPEHGANVGESSPPAAGRCGGPKWYISHRFAREPELARTILPTIIPACSDFGTSRENFGKVLKKNDSLSERGSSAFPIWSRWGGAAAPKLSEMFSEGICLQ